MIKKMIIITLIHCGYIQTFDNLPYPSDHNLVQKTIEALKKTSDMRRVMDLAHTLQEQAHLGSLEAIKYLREDTNIPHICRIPYEYLESAYKGNKTLQKKTIKKIIELHGSNAHTLRMKGNFIFIDYILKERRQRQSSLPSASSSTSTAAEKDRTKIQRGTKRKRLSQPTTQEKKHRSGIANLRRMR